MIVAFALLSILRYANHANTLPVPDININDSTPLASSSLSDVSEPTQNHRKALDILWSCYATTLSCTWTAVHPNMSFHEDKSWPLGSRTGRRICLVLLAVLMPEVIVAWSYAQMSSARQIKRDIDKGNFQKGKRSIPLLVSDFLILISCLGPWTLTHSHFLQMGGFRLRCTECMVKEYNLEFHYKAFHHKGWVGAVTARSFIKLLEKERIIFPRVKAETLIDRGKRDGFLKFFTVLQLLWFSIQIFARVINHVEVTLIEITTTALVTNSFFMYCFWLSKPFDASTPEFLRLAQDPSPCSTCLSKSDMNPASASATPPVVAPQELNAGGGPVHDHHDTIKHIPDPGHCGTIGNSNHNLNPLSGSTSRHGSGSAVDEEGYRASARSALRRIATDVWDSVPEALKSNFPSFSNALFKLRRKSIVHQTEPTSRREVVREPMLSRITWSGVAFVLFLVAIAPVVIPVACAIVSLALSMGLVFLVLLVTTVLLVATASFPVYLAEVISHLPLFSAVDPNIKSEAAKESIITSTPEHKSKAASDPIFVSTFDYEPAAASSSSEDAIRMQVSFERKAMTMFYVERYNDIYMASIFIGVIFGIVFGSIHFCALGSPFLSRGEYITWIIASGYTVLPFVGAMISWIWACIFQFEIYLARLFGKSLRLFQYLVQHIASWLGWCFQVPKRWLIQMAETFLVRLIIAMLSHKRDQVVRNGRERFPNSWMQRCGTWWKEWNGRTRGPADSYKVNFYVLMFSRVCIFGLSIAALRSLSASALSTVPWIDQIPHV